MNTVLEIGPPTGIDMSRAPVATPSEARAAFRLLPQPAGLAPDDLTAWVLESGGRFASDEELRTGQWA